MRYTLISFLLLLCFDIKAQQQFTDILRQTTNRKGVITISQDTIISSLVNGNAVAEDKTPKEASNLDVDDSLLVRNIPSSATKVRMNGYRIQVYAGNSSRQSKYQAESYAGKVRSVMPDITIYTNFISPRWVCRVGDFRTYEEAYSVLQELQSCGGYNDAVIIKTKILVYTE